MSSSFKGEPKSNWQTSRSLTGTVLSTLRSLSDEPRPAGAVKLTGRNGWRIRVGNYRVIYEIKDEALVVMVIFIGHRRQIYGR